MTQWIVFERFLREIALARGFQRNTVMVPSPKLLRILNILTDDEIVEIDRIRNVRNDLVHGFHNRPPVSLRGEGEALSRILTRLQEDSNGEIVSAIERATAEPSEIEGIYNKIFASETRHTRFELSKDAIELLKAATEDGQGQILKLSFLSGRMIQAGVKQYGQDSAKEASRWEAALNELLVAKLVEVRDHKGEVFSLTHAGWQMAEKLAQAGKAE